MDKVVKCKQCELFFMLTEKALKCPFCKTLYTDAAEEKVATAEKVQEEKVAKAEKAKEKKLTAQSQKDSFKFWKDK